ncbi:MurR/RpiR family transcriptional regulator [Faecalibaculum rodentium]|uniref:MurR/RpiR family transcriptional regulator n=1 Tax=Faecalibaculum rodentium TaxID=1702221 RepID=UPI002604D16A|nr:MurR/RpiR family transcriptional regulator [Faecalibaculum rodentium]
MNLKTRIRAAVLTPAEAQIAGYILDHGEAVMEMKLQDFAAAVHVSRSTVIRLMHALGLSGWKELKVELGQWQRLCQDPGHSVDVNLPFSPEDDSGQIAARLARLYQDTLQEMLEVLDHDQLEAALRILEKADCTYVVTAYHNLSMAANFSDKLLSIGKRIQAATSVQTQDFLCCNARSRDAVVFISYSGTYHPLAELIDKAARQGAKLILITGSDDDRFDDRIHARLRLCGRESRLGRMAQFASDMEVHFLLDILYGSLLNRLQGTGQSDSMARGGQLIQSGVSDYKGTY